MTDSTYFVKSTPPLSVDLFNTLQICYRYVEDMPKGFWWWKKYFFFVVNAADNKQRDPKMSAIKIDIDP